MGTLLSTKKVMLNILFLNHHQHITHSTTTLWGIKLLQICYFCCIIRGSEESKVVDVVSPSRAHAKRKHPI